MMRYLLSLYRDICQLRRGPQDLPHSPLLLAAVCAATLLLQLAIAELFGVTGDTLLAGVIGLAFNLGVLHLVLTLRGFGNRFVQTALAWFGCALFFILLLLPVMLLTGAPPVSSDQVTPVQGMLALLALPILGWWLVVDAHILRHALNLPFLGGLAVAIIWIVAELLLQTLMNTPPAAG
jgi:hypothetical protein